MANIEWEPGDFFNLNLPKEEGAFYGLVLSSRTSEGKQAVVMVPEGGVEDFVENIKLSTDMCEHDNENKDNPLGLRLPVRVIDVPKLAYNDLRLFQEAWKFSWRCGDFFTKEESSCED